MYKGEQQLWPPVYFPGGHSLYKTGSTLIRQHVRTFFPLKVDKKGGKTENDRVVSPESVSIHFNSSFVSFSFLLRFS